MLFGPDCEVIGVYSKTKRVIMEGESFAPGHEYPTFDTSIGPLGMVICFDLDFPDGPVHQVAQSGVNSWPHPASTSVRQQLFAPVPRSFVHWRTASESSRRI